MMEAFMHYQPKNEQEATDLKLILDYIKHHPDVLSRESLAAHITSSAFVVDETLSYVLFAHHNIYDSYAWVGGHNDGNPDLLAVAMQEAMEETGLSHVKPFMNDIFTIDVLYVKNHIKKGKYVPDHLHLNATFLLLADRFEPIKPRQGENTDVKWFLIDEAIDAINEPRMVPVYEKDFALIKELKEKMNKEK